MMLGLGTDEASFMPARMNALPYGPAVPPGYAAQPFNCPPGSDFAKSQEVGMCVGADYGPIARTTADGTRVYYDLTGAIGGTEPAAGTGAEWLPGIPNAVVLGALGLLLVLKMAK